MLKAIAKVKSAVSTKSITPYLMHFLIKDSVIHAFDGRIAAGAPFPMAGTCLVPAVEFEKVLTSLHPEKPKIKINKNSIAMELGRFRSKIATLPPEDYPPLTPGAGGNPPLDILAGLKKIRGFISANATHQWALCAYLHAGYLYGTNNITIARVPTKFKDEALIPCWAIDYILSRDEELTHILHEKNYIGFKWDDGSWMRAQLPDTKFPDSAVNLFEGFKKPKWEIKTDWKKSFLRVANLAEDSITLSADTVNGDFNVSNLAEDITTPMPKDMEKTKWGLPFIQEVVQLATHIDFTTYPNPAPFAGADGLEGFTLGRKE